MILRIAFAALLTAALPAAAQSVPAANFSDMWWNPAESGWGISVVQHAPTHKVYAVWYTYDPRERDPSTGQFKPLWLVMDGGTWTSPTTLTGPAYVTNGVPFTQSGANTTVTRAGTFTFMFTSFNDGEFHYQIAPPAGVGPSDPAFNLPTFSGTKPIVRQGF